jgi:hypothetical protein
MNTVLKLKLDAQDWLFCCKTIEDADIAQYGDYPSYYYLRDVYFCNSLDIARIKKEVEILKKLSSNIGAKNTNLSKSILNFAALCLNQFTVQSSFIEFKKVLHENGFNFTESEYSPRKNHVKVEKEQEKGYPIINTPIDGNLMVFMPAIDKRIRYGGYCDPTSFGLQVFVRNGKYGLCDDTLDGIKGILPPIYDDVKRAGFFCIVTKNGKKGAYIIQKEQKIEIFIPIIYDDIEYYDSYFFKVTINGKHGVLCLVYKSSMYSYTQILECIYDNIIFRKQYSGYDYGTMPEGKAQLKGKWGFFNKKGIYIDCIYDETGDFDQYHGIAKVTYRGKHQYIYKDGDSLNWIQKICYKDDIAKKTFGVLGTICFTSGAVIGAIIGIVITPTIDSDFSNYIGFWGTKSLMALCYVFLGFIFIGLLTFGGFSSIVEYLESKKKERIENLFRDVKYFY